MANPTILPAFFFGLVLPRKSPKIEILCSFRARSAILWLIRRVIFFVIIVIILKIIFGWVPPRKCPKIKTYRQFCATMAIYGSFHIRLCHAAPRIRKSNLLKPVFVMRICNLPCKTKIRFPIRQKSRERLARKSE